MNRIEVDEHLRQALRHAPDAELGAPAEISAQIVAAAHRSAAERPPAAAATRRRAPARPWWRWAGSGALASVLMAGVIAMLWRGETPGPGTDEPAAVVAQAPVAAAPMPLPAATPEPSATPAAAPAPAAARPVPPVARRNTRQAAAEAAAPAPAPAERQRVAAAAPPATPAPAAESALQDAARAPAAPAAAGALPPQRLAAAPAARAAALTPWRTLLREGDDLTWQSGAALRVPDAAWLDRLAELTRGRWQVADSVAPALEARQLEWLRGARRIGSFGFEPGAVRWCAESSPCERASVDDQALRALLGELQR